MRTIRTGSASALLLAAHACACAQSTEPPIQQVVIKTGERTMLTYLLHPLLKRMSSAMKEE